jgi:hypothetical protein
MLVLKKHIQIILIVFVTLLLIAIVIWLYHKRIDEIERKIKTAVIMTFTMQQRLRNNKG